MMMKEFTWQMARPTGPPYIREYTVEEQSAFAAARAARVEVAEAAVAFAGIFSASSDRWARAEKHARACLAELLSDDGGL